MVEVHSDGLRHDPAELMASLARGEPVPAQACYFRTALRFCTGAPAWAHLNKLLGLAVGQRQATRVVLDFYRVG